MRTAPVSKVTFGTTRNWDADWIWCTEADSEDTWVCFRKEVILSDEPASAAAWISCETKYQLWVNGTRVIFDGGLNRGPAPAAGYYDRLDLSGLLHIGTNTLAILVWYWGNEGRNNVNSGKGGLLFEASLGNRRIWSDASWKAQVHPAYGKSGEPLPSYLYGGHNVSFDARLDWPDWTDRTFDDSRWESAISLGHYPAKPWGRLEERPIPLFCDFGVKAYKQVRMDETGLCHAVLPYAAQMAPFFRIRAQKEGLRVDIRTDRYEVHGGPGDSINLYRGHRLEYITRSGIQEFEYPYWLFGEEVLHTLPEGVEILSLGYRESGYDCTFEGDFQCDDPFLNDLHEKCRRTLYACMRDNYMDCPDRERGQWIGDVSSQVPQTFYTLGRQADALTRKAISDFIRWKDGRVLWGNVPGVHAQELPSQSLNALSEFGMIMTYCRYTGDDTLLTLTNRPIREYLGLWKMGVDGLVQPRKGDWQWYDHGMGVDGPVLENAWYYSALKAGAESAKRVGTQADMDWYQHRMESIRTHFDNAFLRNGVYRSSENPDDRANAIAVLSGLTGLPGLSGQAEAGSLARVGKEGHDPADKTRNTPAGKNRYVSFRDVLCSVRNATPYMEGYVLEALCRMGFHENAMLRMRERYAPLVCNDNSTLWEDFTVLGTRNHAWSGGPLTILYRHIAGIDTDTPGFASFHVLPCLCGLNRITAAVPSVRGLIRVTVERTEAAFRLEVLVPEGTAAVAGLPLQDLPTACRHTILVNNRRFGVLEDLQNTECLGESEPGIITYIGKEGRHARFRTPAGLHCFEVFPAD